MAYIPYAGYLNLSPNLLLLSLQEQIAITKHYPLIGADKELIDQGDRFLALIAQHENFKTIIPKEAWNNEGFRHAVAKRVTEELLLPHIAGAALKSLVAHLDVSRRREVDGHYGYGEAGVAHSLNRSEVEDYERAWALVEVLVPSHWNTASDVVAAFPDRRLEANLRIETTPSPNRPVFPDATRLVQTSVLCGLGTTRLAAEVMKLSDETVLVLSGGAPKAALIEGLRERALAANDAWPVLYGPDRYHSKTTKADTFDEKSFVRAVGPPPRFIEGDTQGL